MFRNVVLVMMAFTVLGAAQVDAQLLRRLRSVVKNQIDQQRFQPNPKPQNGQQPYQKGAAPNRSAAGQPAQSRPAGRYSNLFDRAARSVLRQTLTPGPTPATPKMGADNGPTQQKVAETSGAKIPQNPIAQFDIARQATQKPDAVELTGPELKSTSISNAKAAPTPNSPTSGNAPRDNSKSKPSASILNSGKSSKAEPEKAKRTVSVLELTGPVKKK